MGLLLAAGLALLVGCTADGPSLDELSPVTLPTPAVTTDTGNRTAPLPTSVVTNRDETGRETTEADNAKSTPIPAPALTPAPTPNVIPSPTPTVRFVVNSTNDAIDADPGNGVCDDGSGNCTLRAAIMEANAIAGANTITLPAGLYALAITGVGEDAARTGYLDITDDLIIKGAGADKSIIDARGLDRVIDILPSTAAVEAYMENFPWIQTCEGPRSTYLPLWSEMAMPTSAAV